MPAVGPTPRDTRSRRSFLRLAGAGGAALAAGGCGGGGRRASARRGQDDADVLNSLLGIEHMALAAYEQGVPLLAGRARRTGEVLLGQERRHAAELTRAIRGLGGRPDRARRSYGLPRLRTGADALQLAAELERTAIAAYADALPSLGRAGLRTTAAEIAANEAQHLALLDQALGRPVLTTAFVTGR